MISAEALAALYTPHTSVRHKRRSEVKYSPTPHQPHACPMNQTHLHRPRGCPLWTGECLEVRIPLTTKGSKRLGLNQLPED